MAAPGKSATHTPVAPRLETAKPRPSFAGPVAVASPAKSSTPAALASFARPVLSLGTTASSPRANRPAPAAPRFISPRPQAARPQLATPRLVPLAPRTQTAASGQPLSPHIQQAIEHSLSFDLSSVRVHSDTTANARAASLSARAVTFGPDIYLGAGEQSGNLSLLAHEATHVVQQQSHTGAQLWSSTSTFDSGSHLEREAHSAAAAVQAGQHFTVQHRLRAPSFQRFGWSDLPGAGTVLNYFANAANMIPGFRLFTIVIGMNPINGAAVEPSAANILRAIVEFIPGGGLITQTLDKYNIFETVGAFVSQQIRALGLVGSSFKSAISNFISSTSLTDFADPGALWEKAKSIFTAPIIQLKNFAVGLAEGIWKLVRDAVLKPIAALAEGTPAWTLLCAVLGKNPVTGEKVDGSPEAVIGGFMTLIHEEEIWNNIKKANALPRAWAWFQGALGGLKGFVAEIPGRFKDLLHSLEWTDVLNLPSGFRKVAAAFGGFAIRFITWAGTTVWDLLQIIFEVVAPAVIPYIKRAGASFKSILKNPMGFVRNLVAAAKAGFLAFGANFGTHLKAGLLDWLTGSIPGVYVPKAFSLLEFGKMAISVLGLSWAQIRGKIVKALGPKGELIMSGLETTFDIVVALVTGGPAAAWEIIKDKLTNLKDMVIDGIINFVITTIITKAVPKLIAMFIPGAGFISAIVSIYDTVMVFVQKLAKIAATVKAFVDSIMDIASGQIGGAAAKVEGALAGLLSLSISFLAGFLGLGNIASKIMAVIEKVRGMVDKALDTAINWIVGKAKALFARLFGGKKDEKPDERTDAQKDQAKLAAIHEAEALVPEAGFDEDEVRPKLASIKAKHKLLTLDMVVDSKQEQEETLHFTASASPTLAGSPKKTKIIVRIGLATLKIPFKAKEDTGTGKKLPFTRKHFKDQVKTQENAINALRVPVWMANYDKFHGTDEGVVDPTKIKGGRTGEAEANMQLQIKRAAAIQPVLAAWGANNAGAPDKERLDFLAALNQPSAPPTGYPYFAHRTVTDAKGKSYDNPIYGKVILHGADQVAGGGTGTFGLGEGRENSSIGAQWKGGRSQSLLNEVKAEVAKIPNATPKILGKVRMNVELPVVDV